MTPKVHKLSNGVRVVCDPLPGWQTVALSVVAGRGARFEDAGRSGWSHLLEHMVFKGTPTRSAKDIALSLEILGGSLDAYTAREHTAYYARLPHEQADLGIELLADVLTAPALRPPEVEARWDSVSRWWWERRFRCDGSRR